MSADESINAQFHEPWSRARPPQLDPRITGLVKPPAERHRTSPWIPVHRLRRVATPPASRLDQPIAAPRRIGVVGLKGGVGKTTLAVLMATTFARARTDDILLVDADTTYGSLTLRTGVSVGGSAHELSTKTDPGAVGGLIKWINRSRDGVWVLPSGHSPAQSVSLDEPTYVDAMRVVHRHFPIMITDCGAGLAGNLMHRVLAGCHSLVLATNLSLDSILATQNSLRFLESIGLGELGRRSVVVLTGVSDKRLVIDLEDTRTRLSQLCREVQVIPMDEHLLTGGFIDIDALMPSTRIAAQRLAEAALTAALVSK